MIPRGELAISYTAIFRSMMDCLPVFSLFRKPKQVTEPDGQLICLSVRTGFDLVLSALDFAPGTEILVTNINIPGMFEILHRHQLVAVPLPVNKHTLHISPHQVAKAITPSTRAILITHLFGAVMDTDEVIAIAKNNRLTVIEDCAQAFAGIRYRGNPRADVAMFSFGLIKTNTTVTGALLQINDMLIYDRVTELNDQLPRQSKRTYFNKLGKALFIKLLTIKVIYTAFCQVCILAGKDLDEVLSGFTRGFPGTDSMKKTRYRPCLPNIRLMEEQITRFREETIDVRRTHALEILKAVPNSLRIGDLNEKNTYWVIPVEAGDAAHLVSQLRIKGFDATQKASSLVELPCSAKLSMTDVLTLSHVVYLPAYPMTRTGRVKLSRLLDQLIN